MNTDAVNRTKLKQSLSCSLDSSIGSPLSSPKCVTSLNNSAHFVEFNTSSFAGSLLSPSSSSEMLVTSDHTTSYRSSPTAAASSFISQPTSSINSPSAVFSSCMFPEIPVFSPTDSTLSSCRTAHVPASDSAYVGCAAASEVDLTSGGVNESRDVAGNIHEGCGSMTSTSFKRSLSGTFSDNELTIHIRSSKTTRGDNNHQHNERSTGSLQSHRDHWQSLISRDIRGETFMFKIVIG